MTTRPIGTTLSLVLLALALAGCSSPAGDDGEDAGLDAGGDTVTDAPTDPATDSDTDSGSESASETHDNGACSDNPWDGELTYGDTYAPGPYGFKGSMCWNPSGAGSWTTAGDTIPDVCLPNQDKVTVCLSDFQGSPDYDFLIVSFTAMWCTYCNAMAKVEDDFAAALTAAGYRTKIIPILEEPYLTGGKPTAVNAKNWKNLKQLEGDVLFDNQHVWLNRVMGDRWAGDAERGYPMWFIVHTSNMLIWDAVAGWDDSLIAWVRDALLPDLIDQPGAVGF